MQRVKQEDTANLAPYSTSASSTAAPTPSDTASPLPTTSSYTDYVLYSGGTGHHDWRYNIMKFAALGNKEIDPSNEQMFIKPVKLNRKDPRTVRRLTDEDRERINKRILERNGNATVKGEGDQDGQLGPDAAEDGKDADGVKKEREVIDLTLVGRGVSGAVPAQAQRHKSGMFKKKIRRVFVSSEEARRLKREEWMPWVLEDDEGNERWIGRLEGGAGESVSAQKSAARSAEADAKGTGMSGWRPEAMQTAEAGGGGSSYVAFVNDPEKEGFQVFPVGRWYRFNQGPKYVTLGTEEAESEYERQQKSAESERWVMRKRNAPANASAPGSSSLSATTVSGPGSAASSRPMSASNSASAQSNSAIRSRLLDKTLSIDRKAAAGQRSTGRPKMRTVVTTSRSGDEDDEMGGRSKSKSRAKDQEMEDDEFDYEEDFQDDEEGVATIDDLADEQETKDLEERIKREMRGANRYEGMAEADEDEEDENELTNTGKDIKKLVRKNDRTGAYDSDDDDLSTDDEASVASLDINGDSKDARASSSHRPNLSTSRHNSSQRPSSHSRHQSGSSSHSRAGSRSGSPSGSALVAKRATSPGGFRSQPGSRNASPGPPGSKRKRVDGSDATDAAEAAKRRKNGGASPPPSSEGSVAGLITEQDLITLFKSREGHAMTTQEVLKHFKKQLKSDDRNKAAIGGLLQAVASLSGSQLVLKAGL